MNLLISEYLICPNCGADNMKLESFSEKNGEVWDGRFICISCSNWYRIERGIVDLLPLSLRRFDLYQFFARKYNLQSSEKDQDNFLDRQRINQIEYFKENFEEYEDKVVNSSFYKALAVVTFVDWMEKNLRPGDSVLDLGCGTAREVVFLAQHKTKVVGIDISEEMIRKGKDKIDNLGLNAKVDFIVGNGENPPIKNSAFQACVCFGALHHFSNPEQTIKNAAAKLVRGGLFYSMDPHDSPIRFIFDLWMKVWKLYHEEANDNPLISQKQLKQWMDAAGLQGAIKLSTYLPPHLLYQLSVRVNVRLLKASDHLFSNFPILRNFAGVICAEGWKL
jgi:ubiquinone/menaquinone biosynthesis C-methylase UbiE/uncharacterized protein YbaR (Trm112 family)